jgi:hypothetical protein
MPKRTTTRSTEEANSSNKSARKKGQEGIADAEKKDDEEEERLATLAAEKAEEEPLAAEKERLTTKTKDDDNAVAIERFLLSETNSARENPEGYRAAEAAKKAILHLEATENGKNKGDGKKQNHIDQYDFINVYPTNFIIQS